MQNLNNQRPIVNPDGTPTTEFMRLLQDRGLLTEDDHTLITRLVLRSITSANTGLTVTDGLFTDEGPIVLTPEASALLDLLTGATVQGSVLFRNATDWRALGPGTAGEVLTTGGAGADPTWTAAGGGGGGGNDEVVERTIPVIADFPTAVNAAGYVITDDSNGIAAIQAAAGGTAVKGHFKAAPAIPFNLYAEVDFSQMTLANNNRVGVGLRESASSKLMTVGLWTSNTALMGYHMSRWTNPTTYSADLTSGYIVPGTRRWIRVEVTATHINLYSGDGKNWILNIAYTPWNAFFAAGGPDQIGICGQIASAHSLMKVLSFSTTAPVVL